MPEHGDGQRGVHCLMASGKARQREVQFALFVTVVEFALSDDGVPGTAAGEPGSATLTRDLTNPAGHRGGIELGHQRNARLRDASLFSADARQTVAEELLMIEREVGDAG